LVWISKKLRGESTETTAIADAFQKRPIVLGDVMDDTYKSPNYIARLEDMPQLEIPRIAGQGSGRLSHEELAVRRAQLEAAQAEMDAEVAEFLEDPKKVDPYTPKREVADR